MTIAEIAEKLSSPPGVIVAADESPKSMKARFDGVGIPDSLEKRAAWRKLIATAPIGEAGAVGVILHPEMLEFDEITDSLQKQGVMIIVKIDSGLIPFGESSVEQVVTYAGDIAQNLSLWSKKGAVATKFRSAFTISETTPSDGCIEANASVQAFLAKASQDAGLVPMVEPEVLRTGSHTLEICEAVTAHVLDMVFEHVKKEGVDLTTTILKPSMITAGESLEPALATLVAGATLRFLSSHAPKELAGINFLSGGIADTIVEQYLNTICRTAKEKGVTNISASFGRAVVAAPLAVWKGNDANMAAAQAVLVERVKRCSQARIGMLS